MISDIKLTKLARSYFGKHDLDLSYADLRVSYGTCIITGKICKIPRADVKSVQNRAEFIAGIIMKIPGIKEVVLQCSFEEEYFK